MKTSQLIFGRNFVKNQRILTPFFAVDLKTNGIRDGMNFTNLT